MNPPSVIDDVYIQDKDNDYKIYFRTTISQNKNNVKDDIINNDFFSLYKYVSKDNFDLEEDKVNNVVKFLNIKKSELLNKFKKTKEKKSSYIDYIIKYNSNSSSTEDKINYKLVGTTDILQDKEPYVKLNKLKITIEINSRNSILLCYKYTMDDEKFNKLQKNQVAHLIRKQLILIKKYIET